MLFYLVLSNYVFGQEKREPICSRFHYEEMLLEKMIRLEHSTNLIMEEFRTIKTEVDTNLAAVKQATEDLKSSVGHELEMLRNASETIKHTAQQAVEQMKEKIEEEIQTNKDVMANIEGKDNSAPF